MKFATFMILLNKSNPKGKKIGSFHILQLFLHQNIAVQIKRFKLVRKYILKYNMINTINIDAINK